MTTDDHDGDDPLQDRGDGDKPTRDARGRWLPGNCPNPKGRPKKKPKVLPDQSDIRIFGHTMVDVVSNGQREMMDRRTALNNKIFESAKVSSSLPTRTNLSITNARSIIGENQAVQQSSKSRKTGTGSGP